MPNISVPKAKVKGFFIGPDAGARGTELYG